MIAHLMVFYDSLEYPSFHQIFHRTDVDTLVYMFDPFQYETWEDFVVNSTL